MEIKAFPALLSSLYEMLAFIREETERAGFDPQAISKIELAVEEALVNIINYAYRESASVEKNVDIECSPVANGGIKIVLRDAGVPYNPLEYKNSFRPQASVEERTVGGYGIFFILNLMDEVNYMREEGHNVLTLVKYS